MSDNDSKSLGSLTTVLPCLQPWPVNGSCTPQTLAQAARMKSTVVSSLTVIPWTLSLLLLQGRWDPWEPCSALGNLKDTVIILCPSLSACQG